MEKNKFNKELSKAIELDKEEYLNDSFLYEREGLTEEDLYNPDDIVHPQQR